MSAEHPLRMKSQPFGHGGDSLRVQIPLKPFIKELNVTNWVMDKIRIIDITEMTIVYVLPAQDQPTGMLAQ
jgi:hypothetical protein